MALVKIAYIVSNINKAIAFEWISQSLDKSKFELHFILLNPADSFLEQFCIENKIPVHRITLHSKKGLPRAALKIWRYLRKYKIEIVHCHLVEAGLAGLWAARRAGVKKRVYSRHHADFHHIYFPRATRYDRIINKNATHIVAVSQLVKNILVEKENVPPDKVTVIHHGFDLDYFYHVEPDRIKTLVYKYKLQNARPVVGVISRYIELKGVQYIIPAFKQLLIDYPDAVLFLANGNGSYSNEIKTLLKSLPENSFRETSFENDNAALYHLFNVFVHVPVGETVEAFGQTYIEAMAAGIPGIYTRSGVGIEMLEHRKNGYVVPFKNSSGIYEGLKEVLQNNALKDELRQAGLKTAQAGFALQNMVNKLEELYAK